MIPQDREKKETLPPWLLAARPRTLPAAAAPVVAATALAWRDGVFHAAAALSCLAVSLLLQIGANYANDLFDCERGADRGDRLGPLRVTAGGLVSSRAMRIGTMIVFLAAAVPGFYLVYLRGWPVLALGAGLMLTALAYTGGPFPYGYYALGDLFVLLTFGVAAVCGTYYAQAGVVTPTAVWISLPLGFLIVNILVVNNTRDRNSDAASGKRTLAVLLGRKAMEVEYLIGLTAAYLVPLGLWLFQSISLGGLLCWLTLPRAILLWLRFARTDGRALNGVLADTAQLVLIYAFLLAGGLVLNGYFG